MARTKRQERMSNVTKTIRATAGSIPREKSMEWTAESTLENVKRLAALGFNKANIAAYFGVSSQSAVDAFKKYGRLQQAFNEGIQSGREVAGLALIKRMQEDGNVEAIKWYEKTRLGMSDTVKVEVKADEYDADALAAKLAETLTGLLGSLAVTEEKEGM